MTCYTLYSHMVGEGILSKHFSSPALTVCNTQCLEDSEKKDQSMNEWIN